MRDGSPEARGLVESVSRLAERFHDPDHAAREWTNAIARPGDMDGPDLWRRLNNPRGWYATWHHVLVASGHPDRS
jgi:hypothetical protein